MKTRRPYLITSSVAHGEGGGSQALTREGIMVEIAMRLTIDGCSVKTSWDTAEAFVKEMDKRLPFEEPQTNADKPIPDLLK